MTEVMASFYPLQLYKLYTSGGKEETVIEKIRYILKTEKIWKTSKLLRSFQRSSENIYKNMWFLHQPLLTIISHVHKQVLELHDGAEMFYFHKYVSMFWDIAVILFRHCCRKWFMISLSPHPTFNFMYFVIHLTLNLGEMNYKTTRVQDLFPVSIYM